MPLYEIIFKAELIAHAVLIRRLKLDGNLNCASLIALFNVAKTIRDRCVVRLLQNISIDLSKMHGFLDATGSEWHPFLETIEYVCLFPSLPSKPRKKGHKWHAIFDYNCQVVIGVWSDNFSRTVSQNGVCDKSKK